MTALFNNPEFKLEILQRFADALGLDLRGAQHRRDLSSFRDLWTLSALSGEAYANQLATFLGLEYRTSDALAGAESLVEKFSPRFLREFGVYPFRSADGVATAAIAEPIDAAFDHAVRIVLNESPDYVVVSYDDLAALLTEKIEDTQDEGAGEGPTPEDDVDSLRDLASGAPVVRALNDLFERAVEARATDLHIEPMRDALSVRLRVDGVLRHIPPPPARMAAAIISRIKILAGLNIAERRTPQDGSARLRISGVRIDLRVAIVPTAHGEAAVIRFLPRDRGLLDIQRLGMSQHNEALIRRMLSARAGLVIVTGPTGSGKTTTLAGALTQLNDASRKILTIEDPIEYELEGVVQSQINPEVGLTFATALRSFLRSDPDVIMVGEIRDGETANIAVQAALTGHLVLTTLHTESAAAAVPRLIDLGVEHFLLRSTLRTVVAQRLIRLLCEQCKSPRTLDRNTFECEPDYAQLGLRVGDSVWEPSGCDRCGGSGFRGRAGIFEVMEVTTGLRDVIRNNSDAPSIEARAREDGFRTMIDDAATHCRLGKTAVSEVLRVISLR